MLRLSCLLACPFVLCNQLAQAHFEAIQRWACTAWSVLLESTLETEVCTRRATARADFLWRRARNAGLAGETFDVSDRAKHVSQSSQRGKAETSSFSTTLNARTVLLFMILSHFIFVFPLFLRLCKVSWSPVAFELLLSTRR